HDLLEDRLPHMLDAVKLMIILSDNTATNLVLDQLASTHDARMAAVNDFLLSRGLKNTRLLNRLYSWQTKKQSPEGIRYGIGVSTPEDMMVLLEALYNKTLADSSSCNTMLDILKQQQYNDKIPRFLPIDECLYLDIAHKTGDVNESKADVGLILSDKANIAIAVFVDKHPDHQEDNENQASLLAAHVARAVWNHFTGSSGHERHVRTRDVDWNRFPGGNWLIYRSSAAPFPHTDRVNGFTAGNGTVYPSFPHYTDSSVAVVIPDGFKETEHGTNVIVHFHGHMNDNMGVLEQYLMPQALAAQKINALLVIPQGPYRARDSFGGKMEDEGGLKRLIEDVLVTMKSEEVIKTTRLNRLILSAHSGGYRPAAFCLDRGGLNEHITDVFLFDAFYGNHDFFRNWLDKYPGRMFAAYTDHLAKEHEGFMKETEDEQRMRVSFAATAVDHEQVVQTFLAEWLSKLDRVWKQE
ncbi:MAG: serine hydrolase, partial [Bacteroidota bacterium]